ncbi:MAG: Flp pilus assembly protein CpaB [Caulobacter sp.]|jgi:pilus assembly protein CpaB|nr:Flp pilus assembly protein CpaB [Caulobacter sp.]
MSPVRLFILVIAAVAAIGLAFVVRGAFGSRSAAPAAVTETAPAKPMVQVLVAKQDLAVGLRITAADVSWQGWPAESLNAAFISDGAAPEVAKDGAAGAAQTAAKTAGNLFSGAGMEQVVGAIVKEPFVKGEPIVLRKVVRGGEGGFMAVVLGAGMRAISAPVTVDTAVAGFILPGDRVDVIYSRDSPDENVVGFETHTVMRNVRVLAIDQKPEPEKDAKSMVGTVATLEIPASASEVMVSALAQAKQSGVLMLVLRGVSDTAGGPSRGGGANSSNTSSMVRVHRAGVMTEVKVSP